MDSSRTEGIWLQAYPSAMPNVIMQESLPVEFLILVIMLGVNLVYVNLG